MGAPCSKPYIKLDEKQYFIYRDPTHLLKKRLMKQNGKIPSMSPNMPAKWDHLTEF